MRNGYFQLISMPAGYGLKVVAPKDGGESVRINEVMEYLKSYNISFDPSFLMERIKKYEAPIYLGQGTCPVANESCNISVSQDNMEVTVRFLAPSELGKRMVFEELVGDLKFRNIIAGLQMDEVKRHFEEGIYCTDIVVARGEAPKEGKDASLEYLFNTDVEVHPTLKEDGSVDFFNLNTINHCNKGDVLARIIPEVPGDKGFNVMGQVIMPREVKKVRFKYGRNIELSEDRLSISSMVDGHVTLVSDTVFVSDIYTVENVDVSTGNIMFNGSVQINGNVASNFAVEAQGNVIINGVVEGAHIKAGGDIIIARGMNGMTKGTLEAGGNIVAKFLENATASAGGYVATESILHSVVKAGTEIKVDGRRGFITGGTVTAAHKITVKTLGSTLGAQTVVEVGVNPAIKERYHELQKNVQEDKKIIESTALIIATYKEKLKSGFALKEEQANYLKSVIKLHDLKKQECDKFTYEMEALVAKMGEQSHSKVVVMKDVFPGTKIIIGDLSKVVQSEYHYVKFEKAGGEIKIINM